MSDLDMETAIKVAGLGADPVWRAEAMRAIYVLAESGMTFTTDDVYALMSDGVTTEEPRAMGSLMRNAHRDGYISPLNEWRMSSRTVAHKNPKRVWRGAPYVS